MAPFCSCNRWSLKMVRITPAAVAAGGFLVGRRVAMLAAALPSPFDSALFGHRQPVLAGNIDDGPHQRRPPVLRLDFVEAEQQPGMKSTVHFAYMSMDRAAARNDALVWTHQVLRQFSFEALPRPESADIELGLETHQKARPLRNRMGRSRRLLLLGVKRHYCESRQKQTQPERTKLSHGHDLHGDGEDFDQQGHKANKGNPLSAGWMWAAPKLLPAHCGRMFHEGKLKSGACFANQPLSEVGLG